MRTRSVRYAWGILFLGGLCLATPGLSVADTPDNGETPQTASEAQTDSATPDPVAAPRRGRDGKVEEVVITGSRIARSNLEGLGPVTVLSSEDIELSGVQTVDELLRELPSVGFQGINQNSNNGGNGLRFVELRNLGSPRTLVLLNGRRFPPNGSGVAEAVDVNNVPTALIERIDVLRDGVSTIYGSDAVAGVINFVLKDDFEGFQMELLGGLADEGDGEEAGANFLWGKNWARSNLTLSGSIFSREEILARDRDFARFPVTFADRNPVPGGDDIRTIGSSFVPEGRATTADNTTVFFRPVFDANGNQISSFQPYMPRRAGDAYNFNEKSFLVPGQKRYVGNASYRYQLTDSLEFFAEAEYAFRDSEQQLAPLPAGGIPTRANQFGLAFPIFADSSRNSPFLPQDFVNAALPAGADSTTIVLNRRLLETANRIFTQESRTQRAVMGFRGELDGPLGPLDWEIFGNYGRNQSTEFLDNAINLTKVLRSIQPEECAKDPACVQGNFFGRNGLLDTPGAIDYIRYEARDRLGFHLKEVGGSISGSAVTLPAGDLKLAVGAEYRQEDGFVSPDFLTVSGDSGGNGLDPTRGNFITRSTFWEGTVPVLANLPGIEEFTLEMSGRYTDYSSFGGKYQSRYGFSYAPIVDLRFRGVFATSCIVGSPWPR